MEIVILVTVLLFAAATLQTVRVDSTPLRSGCSETDQTLATLKAGDQVRLKFSLALGGAPCFLVGAIVDGKTLDGYLPASVLSGADEFERARREAPAVGVRNAGPAPVAPAPPKQAIPSQLKFTVPDVPSMDVDRATQLLDRNQPDQALEILQQGLKKYPNQPGLLALAGMAAYRGDNLRAALEYWRRSLDLEANPVIEQLYLDAKRESALDKSAEKKYGTRFTLRYDTGVADSEAATLMVSMLEEEFSRISSQLGCRADERIVTIVQTREDYMRTTNAAEWSGAAYDGKIRVPFVDRNQLGPEMRETLAHELVHACLANLGRWPTWLHEGLAQKLSGHGLSPRERQVIRAAGRSGKLPRLDGLGRNWSGKSGPDAQLAYNTALAAIELFDEHHSGLGIRNLLNNPDQLKRVTEDLDRRLQAGE